ncbi:MAG: glycosyltransferase family 39 protein [Anaerolineales bacterium]|nr:glycosyltransferase family 39 protein [Anaerolineales bacterium]
MFIDESWNANAAWNWSRTGVNFDPIHSGTLDQKGYEWVRRPNLGTLPWAVVFLIAGAGLFQARLVSFIFGLLLLSAVILLSHKCFKISTGLLAAVFLALSKPFLVSAHFARQEIVLITVVLFLFALSILAFEKDRLWLHFLLGLGLGLSVDIHQNAILFFLGFASLYLYQYRWQMVRKREAWVWVAGLLCGMLYFLGVHVFPNPSAYFLYLSMNDVLLQTTTGMTHAPPILSMDLSALLRSARGELERFHFYENSLDFALIAASLIFIGIRRRKYDWYFLVFLVAAYASFTLVQGSKVYFYDILIFPFYFILMAETLASLIFDYPSNRLQKLFALCLAFAFIVNGARHMLRESKANSGYDYYAISNEIKSVLRPDDRILGSPTWWLGLTEYDYKSAFMLSHYFYFNGLPLAESMPRVAPTILIVDETFFSLFESVDPLAVDAGGEKKLSASEAEAFIDCCTEELLSIRVPQHGGDVIVYRVVNTAWTR